MGGVLSGARGADRRPLPTAGRWLLLLAALGGLLAMHGLSDHGVGGPTAVTTAGAHASSMAGHEGVDAHPGHGAPSDGATGGDEEHHGGALVGMCLAVVGAVLLLGTAARRAGLSLRLREALTTHLAVVAATAFWSRARGPAPPDLTVLSIQRC